MSEKWVQLNCAASGCTIRGSGKTSAKRTMLKRLRREKPRPNSIVNCVPSADTICSPYSARFSFSMSWRIRRPTCQYKVVSPESTARATPSRAWRINSRKSASNMVGLGAGATAAFVLLVGFRCVMTPVPTLHRPYRHGHNVVNLDRLFHHERFAVLGPDLVAVKPGDRAQTLADLWLVREKGATFSGFAILRNVTQQGRHAPLELRADIDDERRLYVGIQAGVEDLRRPMRFGVLVELFQACQ